jgi:ABC-2 type transport system ATP-binding protein
MYQLLVQLSGMKEIKSCFPFGQKHHVVFRQEEDKIKVQKMLTDSGFENVVFEKTDAGIEDSFMALMKKTQEDIRSFKQ